MYEEANETLSSSINEIQESRTSLLKAGTIIISQNMGKNQK
jgi:hypothetical protein